MFRYVRAIVCNISVNKYKELMHNKVVCEEKPLSSTFEYPSFCRVLKLGLGQSRNLKGQPPMEK